MIATAAPICDVSRVLAGMQAAIGAEPSKRFAQATATGSVVMSGLRGKARFDEDLRTGRYAESFDVPVMGRSLEIYDGTTVWTKDISGGVHPYDAWFPREAARTDAFIQSGAYREPRSGATYRCVGLVEKGERPFITIRVQPRGGIPADLAIDVRTHLLASVTERLPIETQVTRYADYRTVDGTVVPFSISRGTQHQPDDDFKFVVNRYKLYARAAPADFARPRPDDRARMIGGSASTTIPLKLEQRQLLVWASIDDHAPMPFILDTGGHAILTTGAARTLGLKTSGAGESRGAGSGTVALQYARVETIRLGRAQLRDQPMLVIDYPYSFYERGRRQPIAGILGLEIFERFATRIDYGDRSVTLTPLDAFSYRGRGTPVSFRFQDDMPIIEAAADGHAGAFGADTGNAGPLVLFGGFLRRTGLGNRYRAGAVAIGHGTGGRNTGRLETLNAYAIGGRSIKNIVADFTNMHSGSFSSWTEAGNAGYEVLSRFIPTFDYANQTLYLDRCGRECVPRANCSGLSFTKNAAAAFTVTAVTRGSPAANAGIATDDRIVAIDGRPATEFSQADLWALLTPATPTQLRLTILHGPKSSIRELRLGPGESRVGNVRARRAAIGREKGTS